MVCSLGGGQMTTLLEGTRSTSQIMSDDAGCWKLAAQYIQRELKEADEVNLLDEEDMHVFGLRPMMDPLILVRCNSCKKPVKVSQYATHADICISLVDSTPDTDVVACQKKPPRKKKLQISISTPVGKAERCTLANTAASNSQTLKTTSFPTQTKRTELINESHAKTMKNFDSITNVETHTKLNDHHLKTKGTGTLSIPAPLATKIFYSQRNQRLRSSISHMYYRSSSTQHDHDHDLTNMQSNNMPSNHGYFQIDETHPAEQVGNHVSCMVENTDSDEPRKLLHMNFSDYLHVNNALGNQRIMGNDVLPASDEI